MKICSKCQTQYETNHTFCTICGNKLENLFQETISTPSINNDDDCHEENSAISFILNLFITITIICGLSALFFPKPSHFNFYPNDYASVRFSYNEILTLLTLSISFLSLIFSFINLGVSKKKQTLETTLNCLSKIILSFLLFVYSLFLIAL